MASQYKLELQKDSQTRSKISTRQGRHQNVKERPTNKSIKGSRDKIMHMSKEESFHQYQAHTFVQIASV